MEGIIDKSGTLIINRKGIIKPTRCHEDTTRFCGDWCSMFGEPTITEREMVVLELCKKTIVFTELLDYRGEKKSEYNK